MSIEAEAVRVAAAAVALVEDSQRGPALRRARDSESPIRRKWWEPVEMVLGLIRDERVRQAARWGDRPRLPVEWLMILTVEAGELAAAVGPTAPADGPARRAIDDLRSAASAARRWLDESGAGPGSADGRNPL